MKNYIKRINFRAFLPLSNRWTLPILAKSIRKPLVTWGYRKRPVVWNGLGRNTLIHDGGPYHIETSPLICRAGFYMIGTFVLKQLKLITYQKYQWNNKITSTCRSLNIKFIKSSNLNATTRKYQNLKVVL